MSIKFTKVAYNCRDDWPTFAEIGGLISPKNTYNLHKSYEACLKEEDKYYDGYIRNKLINEVNSIIFELKMDKKYYYHFDKIDNYEAFLTVHNDNYIAKHLNDKYFDNINKKSLDSEQRVAILKDDISNLVIAGAGSGKTLTICGKVKYLIENGYKPEDLLLLSYSRASANDLEKKVSDISLGLKVDTFHALGLNILNEASGKKNTVDDQFDAIIERYFREELMHDENASMNVLNYYAFYISVPSNDVYENPGELYEKLKEENLFTIKELLSNQTKINNGEKITFKKERVKSIEELAIANFYFLNGIKYEYERSYEVDTSNNEFRQYKPDFYLTDYHIYHEHYGIDENGNCSQYKETEAINYIRGIKWKRELHAINETKCLETYSYEFKNCIVFSKLKEMLIKNGVKLNRLSKKEIFDTVNSIYNGLEFRSFINVVKSFISLYKSKYDDNSAFEELKNKDFPNKFEKKRSILFLNIAKDIYDYYINVLRNENKIDFDDMILKSSKELQHLKSFKYKYIIVDEFQDISFSRMKFLKELIKHGNAKLFAVGDDYQAIYRFSGCDLSIFLNFKKYFEYSTFSYITSTHRNSQDLQNVAVSFITKNPMQNKKIIKSNIRLERPLKCIYYNESKFNALYKCLRDISYKKSDAEILLLGRNNKDIVPYYNNRFFYNNGIKSLDFPKLRLIFTTVHASKGLEAEFVIIINCDDEKLGFPNKTEDDPVLNLVLSDADGYPYAEERRLFYVALTRTKSYTYLIASGSRPSQFIREIINECELIDNGVCREDSLYKCPRCKSGKLILKNGSNGRFYGCSNYPYCEYMLPKNPNIKMNMKCAYCGDFLVYKKGKYGAFYGCYNYPRCNYTKKYNSKN